MSEWKFTQEAILAARELAIGDRVICHWTEAECPDQEATVIGVQIERYGRPSFAVIIDGDLSPTDGFYHDRSGHDAGSISLLRKYPEPASILHHQEERIAELTNLVDRLRMEAQGHASEARTANSTIYEIYQVLSGGKGEPGNWHGAEPARQYVSASQTRVKVLEEALEPFAKWVNAMETNEFLSGSRFSHWSDDYHPVDTLPLSAFRRARNALKSEGEI